MLEKGKGRKKKREQFKGMKRLFYGTEHFEEKEPFGQARRGRGLRRLCYYFTSSRVDDSRVCFQ
jgi:hypothetical protein